MKLKGTKTEQNFRERLINSHVSLFQEQSNIKLLQVLKDFFPEMKTAYFIGHTPEQGEDLYRILINTDTVVFLEMNRYKQDAVPIFSKISVQEYLKGLSKMEQIKMAVALELAQKDLK